jgi:hypothetical protein
MTSPGHFNIAVPKHLLMTFAAAVLVFWLWSGCVPASIFSGIADGTIVCPLGFSDFMTAVPLQQQPRPMAYQAAQAQSHMSTDMLAGISGFQRLGYVVMVGYLFLIFSRIFDVKFGFLHIPGIAYRVFLVMMLLSRAFLPALRHPIGKAMYFLTFWFFLSIPFSMWKGGSLPVFMEAWLPTFVIFLSVSGMLANFDQCRKAIFIVAYGLFVLALIAVFFGNTEESGRLFLTHGKFSNPNEMAQALLMGLPLWWLIYRESKSMGKKVASAGIMFLMLLMISKCGSRGAMITFFVLILMVFVRTSITGKMQVLMSGVAIFAILLALMPGRLMRRYPSPATTTMPACRPARSRRRSTAATCCGGASSTPSSIRCSAWVPACSRLRRTPICVHRDFPREPGRERITATRRYPARRGFLRRLRTFW